MFQLSFLNASLLFFAAATVIPLLIWLLAKKKPLKVLFPTLRFIKLSKEQEKSRSKLKNILLLLIRMLIILLVALAVARPMFNSAKVKPSAKHPPTALAIMVDTSFSMDYADSGKSYLQYAKEALTAINAKAREDDRLILISSNENWNQLHAQIYAAKIPEALIGQLAITYTPLPLEDMLKLAETKLQESQMPNQEIYLLTDNRMEAVKLKSSVPLATIPLPESADYENIACTAVKVLPQLVDKRRQQTIQFTLENHGQRERKEVLVKAVLGEIKMAEKFVNVPARQSITETISVEVQNEGWQSGYIEITDERQNKDNRNYFAFPYYSKPRLAVVSLSSNLPYILSSFLSVYSGATVPIIRPDALSINALDNYSLIVVYDCGTLTPKLRDIFTNLTARKTGVLFCSGNTMAADLKAYLNSAFSLDIKERSTKAISIDAINKHHYASSMIADKQLKNNVIADYWQATSKGSNAIISAQNIPLAVSSGKQSLWLWNIASSQNPFFIDPAFPVFAFRTLDYLATSEIPETEHHLGDILSFDRLKLPEGETVSNRKHLVTEPGIYILEPDTPRASALAVNIDYLDSQARDNPPTGVKNLGKNWQDKLFFSRLGHDLWKILLAIAFALVILELIIVKMEESRSGG
ncbi:MAG: BatA domain-containing protein [Candidatus Cloacimonas sp.]|nr:BatA domain-containing protein [Candidatus Cloacimonas sp.]